MNVHSGWAAWYEAPVVTPNQFHNHFVQTFGQNFDIYINKEYRPIGVAFKRIFLRF